MSDLMERALERVRQWPKARQEEAAQLLMALDELGQEPLDVDDETLAAIDAALAEPGFADSAEVAAAFARFRG